MNKLAIVVCWFLVSLNAYAQKVSLGAVTGVSLFEDFRTGRFTFPGASDPPSSTTYFISDASGRWLVGPRVEVSLSQRLSLEIEAQRRAVRSRNRRDFSVLVDGTLRQFSYTSVGTEFTWEFPVVGKYRFNRGKVNPLIEAGASFRPAENRELYGLVAGLGLEIPAGPLSLAPTLRYTNWLHMQRYLGAVPNQLQLVLGIKEASSAEPFSAFGRKITLGGALGMGVTRDIRTKSNAFPEALTVEFSESTSPVVGIVVETELKNRFSLEVNGLFRPLHGREVSAIPEALRCRIPGCEGEANRPFTILTWEFPFLVKYVFSERETRPLVEVGPSLRASGNLNGGDPSKYGITAGVGLQTRLGKLKIAPTLRYTHWAKDKTGPFGTTTVPNQVEMIFGVTF